MTSPPSHPLFPTIQPVLQAESWLNYVAVLEEAGLKELLEKWPRNKIATLVGSNCDAGSGQRGEGWRALAKTTGRTLGHTV